RLGLSYLSGLLSNLNAKSVEPIALEFLGESGVRSAQRFLKHYVWDEGRMLGHYQTLLANEIASPGGMLTVDSTEFPKKGKESVGVARQYCGRLGKVDNCQSGVFVGYCSDKGYGLVDGRLYMPKDWFSEDHEERRKETLVPTDLQFQTKPEIALDAIKRVAGTGRFPARWAGCDATFGSNPDFLSGLPEGMHYFAQVRSDTLVFSEKVEVELPECGGRGPRPSKPKVVSEQNRPRPVVEVASNATWETIVLAEGAKGPILADVAVLRVWRALNGVPVEEVWLYARRLEDGQIKYALSNAPPDMPRSELDRAAMMRWSIEQCFRDGKSHLGMDHYEHRSWPAWHRHMIYVFLASLFLLRLRVHGKKNTSSNPSAGSEAPRVCLADALP
ncbi:MAG: IS701 family transposase, partial [Candidatus Micrarchaeota archaeon]